MPRGAHPTPESIQRIRGTEKRSSNRFDDAPHPDPGIPKPPDWLSERQRELFEEFAPGLAQMGVLTLRDGQTLGHYCALTETWETVCREREDLLGKRSPAIFKLLVEMRQIEDRFGMSPAARVRLRKEPPKDKDRAESKMGRKGRKPRPSVFKTAG